MMILGSKIFKYVVYGFNIVFFLVGISAFVLGIWVLVDQKDMNALSKISDEDDQDFETPDLLQSGAIIMIVGSIILFFMAFIGCCGAKREMMILLRVYAVLLIVVLVLQIIACAVAGSMRTKFENKLERVLVRNFEVHYDGNIHTRNLFSRGVDHAQVYFDCCGIVSYRDYQNKHTNWSNKAIWNVPITCCILTDKKKYYRKSEDPNILKICTCPKFPNKINSYIHNPCFPKIRQWLVARTKIIIGTACGIAVLQVFGIFAAFLLMRTVKGELQIF